MKDYEQAALAAIDAENPLLNVEFCDQVKEAALLYKAREEMAPDIEEIVHRATIWGMTYFESFGFSPQPDYRDRHPTQTAIDTLLSLTNECIRERRQPHWHNIFHLLTMIERGLQDDVEPEPIVVHSETDHTKARKALLIGITKLLESNSHEEAVLHLHDLQALSVRYIPSRWKTTDY